MKRTLILAVAALVTLIASPMGFATGGNGVVKVSTNLQTWTSGTVFIDPTASFAVHDTTIELSLTSTEIVSELDTGICKVTIDQDGQFQATINCSTPPVPATRLSYAIAFDVGRAGPPGQMIVVPEAIFGYAEVFQSNPNTAIMFWHNITTIPNGDCLRCIAQAGVLTDGHEVWNDTGTPFTVACPVTFQGKAALQTPDGYHDESLSGGPYSC